MPISEWPNEERPREKLLLRGAQALSDAELMAIFLRTGLPGVNAVELARQLLQQQSGLRGLLNLELNKLTAIKGIGPAKAVHMKAALELGQRYMREQLAKGSVLSCPKVTRDYLALRLRDKPYECFYALFLDTKHRIIADKALFRGTIDSASVPIREVVKEALSHNAAALIVAHNHPSGVAEPSMADKLLTDNLQRALELVGVSLLDHFVVGEGELVSFAERGELSRR